VAVRIASAIRSGVHPFSAAGEEAALLTTVSEVDAIAAAGTPADPRTTATTRRLRIMPAIVLDHVSGR
jgi:hypothetical protein